MLTILPVLPLVWLLVGFVALAVRGLLTMLTTAVSGPGFSGACTLINKFCPGVESDPASSRDAFVMEPAKARLARMQGGVRITSRLLSERFSDDSWAVFAVCLTYEDAAAHRARHISDAIGCLRAFAAKMKVPMAYVWVAELQERGALHYHVMVWLPRSILLPHFDSAGWWPHGCTQLKRQRRDMSVGYLAKYASKLASKGGSFSELYPGARMHGCGGLSDGERVVRRWYLAPAWVRQGFDGVHRIVRAIGGGWFFPDNLEVRWVGSPWEMIAHSSNWSTVTFRRRVPG